MAAAWRLSSLGHPVTVVERRPYLGGRAYSFVDKETGCQLDNGQHVFLGCCTSYIRFLDEIGTLGQTYRQRFLRIEVRNGPSRRGVLKALPLPPPLHLLPSFLRYPHIGWWEKLRAVPVLLWLWRASFRKRPELEMESFYDWLRRHGQSERSIDNFWDLIIIPTLNDSSRHASAAMGFMVFQDGLLRDSHGADVGYARTGLSEVMGTAMEERLRERGANLLLGRTVSRLLTNDTSAVTGVELAGGERLKADWYVSALTSDVLMEVLPPALREQPQFAPAAEHTWSPIVDLHIWYDRPVADFDFAAFVESPVQWVFNKSRITDQEERSEQYLCVSLSGAWEFWPLSKQELQELFTKELQRVLPKAKEANVTRFLVVKEQKATFRSLPGVSAFRLPSKTPLANLFLAGDWTDTGWPSTMEGAVRSGETAAESVRTAQQAETQASQT
jgi:squalene-associated FAD-dependent desaturase